MNGCIIPDSPIAVDHWKVLQSPHVRFYFLSHLHADHTVGLSPSWSEKIYCSPASKRLLLHKYKGIRDDLIHELEVNESHVLYIDGEETMTVTLIDARHCPGAVMFYFQGYFGNILYTGDFRYEPELLSTGPLSKVNDIDVLYLDNTYCDPHCVFPTRQQAKQQIIDIIKRHEDYNVIIGLRNLGKEDLLVDLAEYFKTWIVVEPWRLEQCKLLELPNVFTCLELVGFISTTMSNQISKENLKLYNQIKPTIAIQPTALYVGLETCSHSDNIFTVPYSDHSSYTELMSFIEKIKPKKIVPIVKAAAKGPKRADFSSRANMRCFDRFLDPTPIKKVVIPNTVLSLFKTKNFTPSSNVSEPRTVSNATKRRKPLFPQKRTRSLEQVKGVSFCSPQKSDVTEQSEGVSLSCDISCSLQTKDGSFQEGVSNQKTKDTFFPSQAGNKSHQEQESNDTSRLKDSKNSSMKKTKHNKSHDEEINEKSDIKDSLSQKQESVKTLHSTYQETLSESVNSSSANVITSIKNSPDTEETGADLIKCSYSGSSSSSMDFTRNMTSKVLEQSLNQSISAIDVSISKDANQLNDNTTDVTTVMMRNDSHSTKEIRASDTEERESYDGEGSGSHDKIESVPHNKKDCDSHDKMEKQSYNNANESLVDSGEDRSIPVVISRNTKSTKEHKKSIIPVVISRTSTPSNKYTDVSMRNTKRSGVVNINITNSFSDLSLEDTSSDMINHDCAVSLNTSMSGSSSKVIDSKSNSNLPNRTCIQQANENIQSESTSTTNDTDEPEEEFMLADFVMGSQAPSTSPGNHHTPTSPGSNVNEGHMDEGEGAVASPTEGVGATSSLTRGVGAMSTPTGGIGTVTHSTELRTSPLLLRDFIFDTQSYSDTENEDVNDEYAQGKCREDSDKDLSLREFVLGSQYQVGEERTPQKESTNKNNIVQDKTVSQTPEKRAVTTGYDRNMGKEQNIENFNQSETRTHSVSLRKNDVISTTALSSVPNHNTSIDLNVTPRLIIDESRSECGDEIESEENVQNNSMETDDNCENEIISPSQDRSLTHDKRVHMNETEKQKKEPAILLNKKTKINSDLPVTRNDSLLNCSFSSVDSVGKEVHNILDSVFAPAAKTSIDKFLNDCMETNSDLSQAARNGLSTDSDDIFSADESGPYRSYTGLQQSVSSDKTSLTRGYTVSDSDAEASSDNHNFKVPTVPVEKPYSSPKKTISSKQTQLKEASFNDTDSAPIKKLKVIGGHKKTSKDFTATHNKISDSCTSIHSKTSKDCSGPQSKTSENCTNEHNKTSEDRTSVHNKTLEDSTGPHSKTSEDCTGIHNKTSNNCIDTLNKTSKDCTAAQNRTSEDTSSMKSSKNINHTNMLTSKDNIGENKKTYESTGIHEKISENRTNRKTSEDNSNRETEYHKKHLNASSREEMEFSEMDFDNYSIGCEHFENTEKSQGSITGSDKSGTAAVTTQDGVNHIHRDEGMLEFSELDFEDFPISQTTEQCLGTTAGDSNVQQSSNFGANKKVLQEMDSVTLVNEGTDLSRPIPPVMVTDVKTISEDSPPLITDIIRDEKRMVVYNNPSSDIPVKTESPDNKQEISKKIAESIRERCSGAVLVITPLGEPEDINTTKGRPQTDLEFAKLYAEVMQEQLRNESVSSSQSRNTTPDNITKASTEIRQKTETERLQINAEAGGTYQNDNVFINGNITVETDQRNESDQRNETVTRYQERVETISTTVPPSSISKGLTNRADSKAESRPEIIDSISTTQVKTSPSKRYLNNTSKAVTSNDQVNETETRSDKIVKTISTAQVKISPSKRYQSKIYEPIICTTDTDQENETETRPDEIVKTISTTQVKVSPSKRCPSGISKPITRQIETDQENETETMSDKIVKTISTTQVKFSPSKRYRSSISEPISGRTETDQENETDTISTTQFKVSPSKQCNISDSINVPGHMANVSVQLTDVRDLLTDVQMERDNMNVSGLTQIDADIVNGGRTPTKKLTCSMKKIYTSLASISITGATMPENTSDPIVQAKGKQFSKSSINSENSQSKTHKLKLNTSKLYQKESLTGPNAGTVNDLSVQDILTQAHASTSKDIAKKKGSDKDYCNKNRNNESIVLIEKGFDASKKASNTSSMPSYEIVMNSDLSQSFSIPCLRDSTEIKLEKSCNDTLTLPDLPSRPIVRLTNCQLGYGAKVKAEPHDEDDRRIYEGWKSRWLKKGIEEITVISDVEEESGDRNHSSELVENTSKHKNRNQSCLHGENTNQSRECGDNTPKHKNRNQSNERGENRNQSRERGDNTSKHKNRNQSNERGENRNQSRERGDNTTKHKNRNQSHEHDDNTSKHKDRNQSCESGDNTSKHKNRNQSHEHDNNRNQSHEHDDNTSKHKHSNQSHVHNKNRNQSHEHDNNRNQSHEHDDNTSKHKDRNQSCVNTSKHQEKIQSHKLVVNTSKDKNQSSEHDENTSSNFSPDIIGSGSPNVSPVMIKAQTKVLSSGHIVTCQGPSHLPITDTNTSRDLDGTSKIQNTTPPVVRLNKDGSPSKKRGRPPKSKRKASNSDHSLSKVENLMERSVVEKNKCSSMKKKGGSTKKSYDIDVPNSPIIDKLVGQCSTQPLKNKSIRKRVQKEIMFNRFILDEYNEKEESLVTKKRGRPRRTIKNISQLESGVRDVSVNHMTNNLDSSVDDSVTSSSIKTRHRLKSVESSTDSAHVKMSGRHNKGMDFPLVWFNYIDGISSSDRQASDIDKSSIIARSGTKNKTKTRSKLPKHNSVKAVPNNTVSFQESLLNQNREEVYDFTKYVQEIDLERNKKGSGRKHITKSKVRKSGKQNKKTDLQIMKMCNQGQRADSKVKKSIDQSDRDDPKNDELQLAEPNRKKKKSHSIFVRYHSKGISSDRKAPKDNERNDEEELVSRFSRIVQHPEKNPSGNAIKDGKVNKISNTSDKADPKVNTVYHKSLKTDTIVKSINDYGEKTDTQLVKVRNKSPTNDTEVMAAIYQREKIVLKLKVIGNQAEITDPQIIDRSEETYPKIAFASGQSKKTKDKSSGEMISKIVNSNGSKSLLKEGSLLQNQQPSNNTNDGVNINSTHNSYEAKNKGLSKLRKRRLSSEEECDEAPVFKRRVTKYNKQSSKGLLSIVNKKNRSLRKVKCVDEGQFSGTPHANKTDRKEKEAENVNMVKSITPDNTDTNITEKDSSQETVQQLNDNVLETMMERHKPSVRGNLVPLKTKSIDTQSSGSTDCQVKSVNKRSDQIIDDKLTKIIRNIVDTCNNNNEDDHNKEYRHVINEDDLCSKRKKEKCVSEVDHPQIHLENHKQTECDHSDDSVSDKSKHLQPDADEDTEHEHEQAHADMCKQNEQLQITEYKCIDYTIVVKRYPTVTNKIENDTNKADKSVVTTHDRSVDKNTSVEGSKVALDNRSESQSEVRSSMNFADTNVNNVNLNVIRTENISKDINSSRVESVKHAKGLKANKILLTNITDTNINPVTGDAESESMSFVNENESVTVNDSVECEHTKDNERKYVSKVSESKFEETSDAVLKTIRKEMDKPCEDDISEERLTCRQISVEETQSKSKEETICGKKNELTDKKIEKVTGKQISEKMKEPTCEKQTVKGVVMEKHSGNISGKQAGENSEYKPDENMEEQEKFIGDKAKKLAGNKDVEPLKDISEVQTGEKTEELKSDKRKVQTDERLKELIIDKTRDAESEEQREKQIREIIAKSLGHESEKQKGGLTYKQKEPTNKNVKLQSTEKLKEDIVAETEETKGKKQTGEIIEEPQGKNTAKQTDGKAETDNKAENQTYGKAKNQTDGKAENQTDGKAENQTDNKLVNQTDNKAENQTVGKAKNQTDGKAENQTDGKAENLTVGKAENQTDGKAENHTDGKAKNQTDGKAENQTIGKAENQTVGKAKNQTDNKLVNQTDNKAENQTVGKAKNQTDGKAENQTDDKAKNLTDGKAENLTDGKAENQTDGTAENQSDDKAENQTDAKAENQTDGKAENQTDDKAENQTVGKAENQTDGKAENQSDDKAKNLTDGKAENLTDGKAENQTDGTAENQSDDKAENQTDGTAENQSDDKAENQTDGKAENQSDDKVKNLTDGKAENLTDGKAENQTDDTAENQTDGKAENLTDGKAENQTDGTAKNQTDGTAENQSDDKAENQSDDKAENQTDDKAENQSDDKAKNLTDGKAKNQRVGKAKNQTDGKAENLTDGKAENLTDGKAENQTDGTAENQSDDKSENQTDNKVENRTDDNAENQSDDNAENQKDEVTEKQCELPADKKMEEQVPEEIEDLTGEVWTKTQSMKIVEEQTSEKVEQVTSEIKEANDQTIERTCKDVKKRERDEFLPKASAPSRLKRKSSKLSCKNRTSKETGMNNGIIYDHTDTSLRLAVKPVSIVYPNRKTNIVDDSDTEPKCKKKKEMIKNDFEEVETSDQSQINEQIELQQPITAKKTNNPNLIKKSQIKETTVPYPKQDEKIKIFSAEEDMFSDLCDDTEDNHLNLPILQINPNNVVSNSTDKPVGLHSVVILPSRNNNSDSVPGPSGIVIKKMKKSKVDKEVTELYQSKKCEFDGINLPCNDCGSSLQKCTCDLKKKISDISERVGNITTDIEFDEDNERNISTSKQHVNNNNPGLSDTGSESDFQTTRKCHKTNNRHSVKGKSAGGLVNRLSNNISLSVRKKEKKSRESEVTKSNNPSMKPTFRTSLRSSLEVESTDIDHRTCFTNMSADFKHHVYRNKVSCNSRDPMEVLIYEEILRYHSDKLKQKRLRPKTLPSPRFLSVIPQNRRHSRPMYSVKKIE